MDEQAEKRAFQKQLNKGYLTTGVLKNRRATMLKLEKPYATTDILTDNEDSAYEEWVLFYPDIAPCGCKFLACFIVRADKFGSEYCLTKAETKCFKVDEYEGEGWKEAREFIDELYADVGNHVSAEYQTECSGGILMDDLMKVLWKNRGKKFEAKTELSLGQYRNNLKLRYGEGKTDVNIWSWRKEGARA